MDTKQQSSWSIYSRYYWARLVCGSACICCEFISWESTRTHFSGKYNHFLASSFLLHLTDHVYAIYNPNASSTYRDNVIPTVRFVGLCLDFLPFIVRTSHITFRYMRTKRFSIWKKLGLSALIPIFSLGNLGQWCAPPGSDIWFFFCWLSLFQTAFVGALNIKSPVGVSQWGQDDTKQIDAPQQDMTQNTKQIDAPQHFTQDDDENKKSSNTLKRDSNDRFIESDATQWIKPKTSLKQSQFKKIYDQYKQDLKRNNKQLDDNEIKLCLPKSMQFDYDQIPYDNVEEKCVHLWSMDGKYKFSSRSPLKTKLYHELNNSLTYDDHINLKRFMPIIVGINKFIVTHPVRKELRTYRGSKLSDKQFAYYKKDNEYRGVMFTATTSNKDKAEEFKKDYMIEFIIPKRCFNAASIKGYSAFPDENEYLLPQYTAFRVKEKSSNKMVLYVLENMAVQETVDTSFT